MNTGWCKWALLLFVPFVLAVSAAAQDAQRVETFGGYSFTHGTLFVPSGTTASGWDTSTTISLKRWFGITTDFAGHYGAANFLVPYPPPPYVTPGTYRDTAHGYTFLFGPHFTYRRSRYAPFVQTLFGVLHNWVSQTQLTPITCTPPAGCGSTLGGKVSSSGNNFAMAVGGGLESRLAMASPCALSRRNIC